MPAFSRSLVVLFVASVACAADNPLKPEDLRRGLVAVHTDAGKPPVKVFTLEPLIALNLAAGEASHPRLRADGGRIVWTGHIHIQREGKYTFAAVLRGAFALKIDGKVVFAVEGKGATPTLEESREVELPAGIRTLEAVFTRLPGKARLELFWQGPGFRREPLPSDHVGCLPAKVPPAMAQDRLADAGRLLVEEASCVRCHTPADNGAMSKTIGSRMGPDLTRVGQRVFAGYLESWLESPSKWRPGTAMPEMFAPAEKVERHAVARYLAALGGPLAVETTKPAQTTLAAAARGEAIFTRVGCAACHGQVEAADEKRQAKAEPVALYQPARVIPLKGLGSKTTAKKLAEYLRNPLALNAAGRMPHMLLSENEANDLAAFFMRGRVSGVGATLSAEPSAAERLLAFKRVETRDDEVKDFVKLKANEQWLELGKRLVLEKGCNSCHTIEPDGKPFASVLPGIDLDELANPEKHDRGCLAEKPPKTSKSPRYVFTKEQRSAVAAFLTRGLCGAGSPAPLYLARLDLQRFNCLACHTRDGEGGLKSALVKELQRAQKADHAEAVVPPSLTGTGHKLRTPWLKQVLLDAGRARPWIQLRMPQFGADNVGKLPLALAALEGAEPDDGIHAVKLDAAGIAAGRQLIGKSALGCISCHDLAGVANTGTRGPDLAGMRQRVRYEWYRRWLEQPQRLSPGTRMPMVFPEGKSLLKEVLGGKADAQADAMWGCLSLEGIKPEKPGRRRRRSGLDSEGRISHGGWLEGPSAQKLPVQPCERSI